MLSVVHKGFLPSFAFTSFLAKPFSAIFRSTTLLKLNRSFSYSSSPIRLQSILYSSSTSSYLTLKPQFLSSHLQVTSSFSSSTMSETSSTSPTSSSSTSTSSTQTPEGFYAIKEGQASILCPKRQDGKQEVFYNPVQETNRDLSISVLRTFTTSLEEERISRKKKTTGSTKNRSCVTHDKPGDKISICEALSATGLRSIRYYKEIPNLSKIIVNDIDPKAVDTIKRNLEFNECPLDVCVPNLADATTLLYNSRTWETQFDVIDLDPYGSPSPFLDGAIQAVKDEGLLCVTATDLAVLCGNHIDTCYSKYGATAAKGPFCHENALRILLGTLETHANRYKRHIFPLVSLHIDFYIRVFVRVYTSANDCRTTLTKIGHLHQCTGCHNHRTLSVGRLHEKEKRRTRAKSEGSITTPQLQITKYSPNCDECGKSFHISGPIWLGQLYDEEFLDKLRTHVDESNELGAQKRIIAMLSGLRSELPDVPLYYSLSDMCNTLHVVTPPYDTISSALLNGGYRVSRSHTDPQAIKTDAPASVVWDTLRCWTKDHPVKNLGEGSPAAAILKKEPQFIADFTHKDNPIKKSGPMYLPAPQANWGPKARAMGGKRAREEEDKKQQSTGATEGEETKKAKVDQEATEVEETEKKEL